MGKLDSDLNKLSGDVKKLQTELNRNFKFDGNITFSYEEQELVRRIIKSVLTQMRSKSDIEVAKVILEKTEWVDEL